MIINCSECNKRYQVESEQIPPRGRQVRCSACGHVWLQPPANAHSEPIPQNHPRKPKLMSAFLGWSSLIVIVFGLLGFSLLEPNTVVTYLPQSKHIYNFIGVPASIPGEGLTITEAEVVETQEGTFVVKGNIQNTSNKTREVAPLHIRALGPNNCEKPDANRNCVMKQWQLTLDQYSLLPGEQLRFESSPYPLVDDAQSIGISF